MTLSTASLPSLLFTGRSSVKSWNILHLPHHPVQGMCNLICSSGSKAKRIVQHKCARVTYQHKLPGFPYVSALSPAPGRVVQGWRPSCLQDKPTQVGLECKMHRGLGASCNQWYVLTVCSQTHGQLISIVVCSPGVTKRLPLCLEGLHPASSRSAVGSKQNADCTTKPNVYCAQSRALQ